jgi:hypothetical protein
VRQSKAEETKRNALEARVKIEKFGLDLKEFIERRYLLEFATLCFASIAAIDC